MRDKQYSPTRAASTLMMRGEPSSSSVAPHLFSFPSIFAARAPLENKETILFGLFKVISAEKLKTKYGLRYKHEESK